MARVCTACMCMACVPSTRVCAWRACAWRVRHPRVLGSPSKQSRPHRRAGAQAQPQRHRSATPVTVSSTTAPTTTPTAVVMVAVMRRLNCCVVVRARSHSSASHTCVVVCERGRAQRPTECVWWWWCVCVSVWGGGGGQPRAQLCYRSRATAQRRCTHARALSHLQAQPDHVERQQLVAGDVVAADESHLHRQQAAHRPKHCVREVQAPGSGRVRVCVCAVVAHARAHVCVCVGGGGGVGSQQRRSHWPAAPAGASLVRARGHALGACGCLHRRTHTGAPRKRSRRQRSLTCGSA
jgi:hypothetical protein